MRFDREMPRKRRRKKAEEHPEEGPGELEESVEAEEAPETEPEAPVAEAAPEVIEETKEKVVYEEAGKGKYAGGYMCTPTKKGFCKLRERTKQVYGVKYAAGKGEDIMKKGKIAITSWNLVLPRKGSARRKRDIDLL